MVDMVVRGIVDECRGAEARFSIGIYALLSATFRSAAEEAFLEQTPWANPQHPIHQQQHQQQQQQRPWYCG
jgi:hypothetical protein